MKNKKHVWVAGAMCVLPFMAMAQQVEPLTDSRRLFDDGAYIVHFAGGYWNTHLYRKCMKHLWR